MTSLRKDLNFKKRLFRMSSFPWCKIFKDTSMPYISKIVLKIKWFLYYYLQPIRESDDA